MKDKILYENGNFVISKNAISTIAGSVAVECFGIVGMASVNVTDGIVHLLKRDSIQKGIQVIIDDDNNSISLKLHIIVAYGVSIYAVCENLCENIRYKVSDYTGMKVDKVDIFVEGVRPID